MVKQNVIKASLLAAFISCGGAPSTDDDTLPSVHAPATSPATSASSTAAPAAMVAPPTAPDAGTAPVVVAPDAGNSVAPDAAPDAGSPVPEAAPGAPNLVPDAGAPVTDPMPDAGTLDVVVIAPSPDAGAVEQIDAAPVVTPSPDASSPPLTVNCDSNGAFTIPQWAQTHATADFTYVVSSVGTMTVSCTEQLPDDAGTVTSAPTFGPPPQSVIDDGVSRPETRYVVSCGDAFEVMCSAPGGYVVVFALAQMPYQLTQTTCPCN